MWPFLPLAFEMALGNADNAAEVKNGREDKAAEKNKAVDYYYCLCPVIRNMPLNGHTTYYCNCDCRKPACEPDIVIILFPPFPYLAYVNKFIIVIW